MKLCKNCKHEKRAWLSYVFLFDREFSKCAKGKYESLISPVTGKPENAAEYSYCTTMRNSRVPDKCGKEGKLWEPKNEIV